MNERMRDDAILWGVEPEGAGTFSGGSLTVWPNQVGVVMQDGKVVDIFSEDKKKLPRRGEVRVYVASTVPFTLTFWLMDPMDREEPGDSVVLGQPVLTSDDEVVTAQLALTMRVVRKNVEHLLKLLRRGRGGVTRRDVSDAIKGELLAKVLALDIHGHTAEELRGNRELFRGIYESLNIELASTIRFYGLQLDNFTVNWGLTSEERERIRERRHEEELRAIERKKEIDGTKQDGMKEEEDVTVEKPSDGIGGGWEEIGYSFKNGKRSMENVPDWARKQIPKYRSMFHTTDRHSGRKSYYLDGRTFTYRIFFSRVYKGTNLRVYRTLRENPPEVNEPSSHRRTAGGYWVYEDRVTSQARVHEGSCRYCNHGEGMGHGRIPGDSEWYGSYGSRDEAFRRAEATGQRDVRGCKVCRP